ncbi:hypothetical protein FIBSPDRAFT_830338 [Athelia psychrophila]|uniref:Afadin and alpha-actinin-binding-domain-containing protein n=1 Tax=Athelia psychrophila TaxID=1759441 RepID=A0A166G7X3_9AGAM|nr:hypothetical protein FIBSPDRAFT_830338 [Fibularhizoctonia sp. CBS 109695]
MASTPQRNLGQWALDISLSDFGSPCSVQGSGSTLQYINSQLVAHGFTTAPGLSLDALDNEECEALVKCMMGMLSQRVEDMARTEALSTKFKTLSYDHERLVSMNRTANERAANAEREMTMHKSRLASAQRALQSTETAHKHTTAELQRTRTLLQSLRLTHQSELKRRDLAIDRMTEKWSKVCDTQLRLGSGSGSGMVLPVHANVKVVDGSEVLGKGAGYLEIALDQAERGRADLAEDNAVLRSLVVDAVNGVRGVLSHNEPTPMTQTALFPLHPPTAAQDTLASLLSALRDAVARNSPPSPSPSISPSSTHSAPSSGRAKSANGDREKEIALARLQEVVDTLRGELEEAQKQSLAHAESAQTLFDKIHAQEQEHAAREREARDASVELMLAPAQDAERELIERTKKGLDEERKKFTEAAVKLGREKAKLEAQRIRFLDEKRAWQVELMLAELPPTPAPVASSSSAPVPPSSPAKHKNKPPSSPRKSPRKVGSGSPRKTRTRVSRRSSSGLGLGERIQPSFETEVAVVPSASSFPGTAPVFPPPPPFPSTSTLTSTFVLPPPSPHSSLPRAPALLGLGYGVDVLPMTMPLVLEPKKSTTDAIVTITAPTAAAASAATAATTTTSKSKSASPPEMPSTPPARKFPFAPRLVHAYSPAKPSPLSRILLMNDSPASPPDGTPLGDVAEEEEEGDSPMPAVTFVKPDARPQAASADLGTEDSPLREKKVPVNADKEKDKKGAADEKEKEKDPRFTSKEKGKGRAPAHGVSRHAAVEKENTLAAQALPTVAAKVKASVKPVDPKKSVKVSTSTAKPGLKLGTGGPRRVPIQSAQAGGWRG